MVGTDANSETQQYFSHDPIHRQDLQTLASVNDLNFGWMERMRESRQPWLQAPCTTGLLVSEGIRLVALQCMTLEAHEMSMFYSPPRWLAICGNREWTLIPWRWQDLCRQSSSSLQPRRRSDYYIKFCGLGMSTWDWWKTWPCGLKFVSSSRLSKSNGSRTCNMRRHHSPHQSRSSCELGSSDIFSEPLSFATFLLFQIRSAVWQQKAGITWNPAETLKAYKSFRIHDTPWQPCLKN